MTFVIITLGSILIIFNFVLGRVHLNLYLRGIYNSGKRFSYKRLNQCIRDLPDNQIKLFIIKIRKLYLTYLILLYLEAGLIVMQLMNNYIL
jgi:hypothetical protein